MLAKLVKKELRLALVTPAIVFEFFAVMMLIPAYPFMVVFFYGLLGIFFICMFGRENHDVEYTALLPVSRADIVSARFILCVGLELMLIGLSAVFAAMRPLLGLEGNMAGMDPNAAFFGVGLALMAVFNLIFFPMYYRNTNKIGIPFLIASLVFAAGTVLAESADRITAFGSGPARETTVVLIIGSAAYALLTWLAHRISVRRFQRMNLNS